jgi:hypothetical protein
MKTLQWIFGLAILFVGIAIVSFALKGPSQAPSSPSEGTPVSTTSRTVPALERPSQATIDQAFILTVHQYGLMTSSPDTAIVTRGHGICTDIDNFGVDTTVRFQGETKSPSENYVQVGEFIALSVVAYCPQHSDAIIAWANTHKGN